MNKLALILVLLVVTIGGAAWILRSLPEQERTSLRVQLQWFNGAQFAGLYVALDKGYFEEQGLDVTLQAGGPNIDPIAIIQAGGADLGLMTADQLLIKRDAGLPLRALGVVFNRTTAALALRDTSAIARELRALDGKTAMVYDGFDTGNILSILEARSGSHATHVFPGAIQAPDAFRNGTADIFGVYVFNEPVLLHEMDIPFQLLLPSDVGVDYYADTFFTTDQIALRKPDIFRRFLVAVAKGWRTASDDPEAAISSMLRLTKTVARSDSAREVAKLNELVAPRGIRRDTYLQLDEPAFSMTPKTWNAMCAALYRIGQLHHEPCEQLLAQLVDYDFPSSALALTPGAVDGH